MISRYIANDLNLRYLIFKTSVHHFITSTPLAHTSTV